MIECCLATMEVKIFTERVLTEQIELKCLLLLDLNNEWIQITNKCKIKVKCDLHFSLQIFVKFYFKMKLNYFTRLKVRVKS